MSARTIAVVRRSPVVSVPGRRSCLARLQRQLEPMSAGRDPEDHLEGAFSVIDRTRRAGLVTLLAAGLLVTNTPGVGVVDAGAGSCVSEAGPVGQAFVDCGAGQDRKSV